MKGITAFLFFGNYGNVFLYHSWLSSAREERTANVENAKSQGAVAKG